ncbi:c-type cytochrome biogenesis protein CcmI [Magnetospirillum sp. SS-4]|uniref:c-type cytochrome biogenesis protein CcmI n=1 Tax=Magnetospirillum sp. SS-4 TaxID=2681465 RepID=UPI00137F99B7|nr:c-type cytochrome biogenesis protein CcmI [Magnetospirillum sp. SS-4]CAA7612507.1 Cytochrome c-type biogenesis protein cycH [Magnetospirillum sp. SS-4]
MIWIVFAAMVALALAVLLRPLLRPAAPDASRAEYDLAVYRDQLDEIGRDIERGLLSADQAEAARTEIQRRMLNAAETGSSPAPATGKSGGAIAMAIAVALPLAALGLYLPLGVPELPDQPYSGRADQVARMKEQASTIQAMVERLAERLKTDPADGKGWAMLGRSYAALGQIEEAKDAYRNAVTLLKDDVPSRVEYASLLMDEAEGGKLPVDVVRLMTEVLLLDPDQPDALYFVGLDAAIREDKETAGKLWTRLLNLLPADSPARAHVQQQLDALKS